MRLTRYVLHGVFLTRYVLTQCKGKRCILITMFLTLYVLNKQTVTRPLLKMFPLKTACYENRMFLTLHVLNTVYS